MKLASKLGDTKTFRIPLRWENARFLPDVNYNLTFTLKKNIEDPDDVSVIQKATGGLGIVIDGSNALLTIIRSDTFREADFPDPGDPAYQASAGTYYWDIQADGVGLFEGESKTVASGEYLLSRDVTRMTGPSIPIYTYDPSIIDPNNVVQVASPANDDMIQRVGGSWVTRTIAQVRTALGLGSAAYTASTAYATAVHTHVSADITDASDSNDWSTNPGKLVKFNINGGISGTSENGTGVSGTSDEGGSGVFGSSSTGIALYGLSNSGEGLYAKSNVGGYHARFGSSVDDRSFISRVLGLIGWHRGAFTQTLGSPATLAANSDIRLPDIASGTVALTSDSRFADERVPTAAGLTSKFSTAKATPVNADGIAILDSAASDAPKKVTWTNAWVNYFKGLADALYVGLTGNQTIAGNKTLSGQTELTGQAATNSTSAMTRGLGDTRYGGPIQLVTLNANQTVTNSTTLVDATGLIISMDANSDYEVEICALYNMDAAAGVVSYLKYSAGGSSGIMHEIFGAISSTATSSWHTTTADVLRQDASGSRTTYIHTVRGVIKASSSRTLKVQFSNFAASGNTVLQAGSYIKARKMN